MTSAFTPDYPDFATPVAVLDQSSVLFGIPTAPIVPNGAAVTVDTGRVQSAHVALTLPPAAPATSKYLVQAKWLESGREVGRETLSFGAGSAYAGTASLFWQLPAYGSQLSLQAVGDDNANISAVVIGSTRAIPAQRLTRAGLTLGKVLLDSGAVVINAGTSQTFRLPPVERAITWGASWPIVAGSVDVRGIYDTQAGGMLTSRLDLVVNPNGFVMHSDVLAPLVGLEVTVTNNDAANKSGSLFVWDVS